MDLLSSFKLWLQSRRYSLSTIKNYLSDINRYLGTLPPPLTPDTVFSSHHLNRFFQPLTADSNLPRYLASLNLFCQFAQDQGLIVDNPLKTTRQQLQSPPQIDLNNLLTNYQKSLELHHSPATVKNYLADVKRYLIWKDHSAT